jgi:hypothetical protein
MLARTTEAASEASQVGEPVKTIGRGQEHVSAIPTWRELHSSLSENARNVWSDVTRGTDRQSKAVTDASSEPRIL